MPSVTTAFRVNDDIPTADTWAFKGRLAWVLNLIAFQLAWLANIAGGALLGVFASALCIGLFFVTLATLAPTTHRSRVNEAVWVVAVAALGWMIERGFIAASVFTIKTTEWSIGAVPVWLFLIWACFATTFRLSMNYFVHHLHWAFLAGTLSTLSYATGVALNGSVSYGYDRTISLTIIAVVWSMVFPLMCFGYRKLTDVN